MRKNVISIVLLACLIASAIIALWAANNPTAMLNRPLAEAAVLAGKLNLAFDQAFYGKENAFEARELMNLASLNSTLGKVRESDKQSAQALKLYEKTKREDKTLFSILLHRGYLANDSNEAVAALTRALKLAYRHAFSTEFPALEIARAEELLADELSWRGENQAEQLHIERALDLRQLADTVQDLSSCNFLPDYQARANLLEDLASSCADNGQIKESNMIAQEAELARKKAKQDTMAEHWFNLAYREMSCALLPRAEEDYRKGLSLATEERNKGSLRDEYTWAWANYNLATCLFAQQKFEEAELILQKADPTVKEKMRPSCHALVQALLAAILAEKGRTEASLKLFELAEPIINEQIPFHKRTMEMYLHYAKALKQAGDAARASQMLAKAELIRLKRRQRSIQMPAGSIDIEQIFVLPAPKQLRLMENKIATLKSIVEKKGSAGQTGDKSLAAEILSLAEMLDAKAGLDLDKLNEVPAPDSTNYESDIETPANNQQTVAEKEKTLAKLDYESASQEYQRAMQLLKPDSPLYLRCLIGLGKTYINLNDNDKAEQTLSQALALSEKGRSADSQLKTAEILNYLSTNNPANITDENDLNKHKFELLKRSCQIYKNALGSGSGKMTTVLFDLADLAWHVPEAKPSGKEILKEAYSSQADLLERDLTAFGPVHPQIIEDLDIARGFNYDAAATSRVQTAIFQLFFGDSDIDLADQLKSLTTFQATQISQPARLLFRWNCLLPMLILLFGLLVFSLARLPNIRAGGDKRAIFSMLTLYTFYAILFLILLLLPQSLGFELPESAAELDEKLLKRALVIEEKSKDSAGSLDTLTALGSLCFASGNNKQAEAYYKEAEEICAKQKDLPDDKVLEFCRKYRELLLALEKTKQVSALDTRIAKLQPKDKAASSAATKAAAPLAGSPKSASESIRKTSRQKN